MDNSHNEGEVMHTIRNINWSTVWAVFATVAFLLGAGGAWNNLGSRIDTEAQARIAQDDLIDAWQDRLDTQIAQRRDERTAEMTATVSRLNEQAKDIRDLSTLVNGTVYRLTALEARAPAIDAALAAIQQTQSEQNVKLGIIIDRLGVGDVDTAKPLPKRE